MNTININEFQNYSEIYAHIEDNKLMWVHLVELLKQLNGLLLTANTNKVFTISDTMRIKMVMFVVKICTVYKLDNQDLSNARCLSLLNQYLPKNDTLFKLTDLF